MNFTYFLFLYLIASRTNISNISSRLIESKSDILTKVVPGIEVSNSLPSSTSQVSTNTSSSKSLPQKPAVMEKETEALVSYFLFTHNPFFLLSLLFNKQAMF